MTNDTPAGITKPVKHQCADKAIRNLDLPIEALKTLIRKITGEEEKCNDDTCKVQGITEPTLLRFLDNIESQVDNKRAIMMTLIGELDQLLFVKETPPNDMG